MTAPVLGLAEAARATGVSESTLRRKRPELLKAGATQGPKGWSIPIPVLVELGLLDKTTSPSPERGHDSPSAPPEAASTAPATPPSTEPLLEALRAKLAEAEKRAAVAEAIAEERERIIQVQAQALRMIEAPRTPQEQPAPTQAPVPEPSREQPSSLGKLRFWKR